MVSSSDRRPWHRRPYSRPAVAGLVAALLAVLATAGLAAGILAGYHGPSLDPLFPRGTADERIVVVGIDARSIREIGQAWPWARDVHAELIRNLRRLGASAVGYDVVFDLPREGDEALEEALSEAGGVVLAVGREAGPGGTEALVLPRTELADAAAALGHALTTAGPADGVVRHVPLLVAGPDGAFLPALSLATVAVASGVDPAVATLRPGGVQLGDRRYPTEEGLQLRISYADGLQGPDAPGAHYLSAIDVLRGDVTRDLAGAVVFVGAADPLLGDRAPTPVRRAGAGGMGVYVHANAANTLLSGGFLEPVGSLEIVLAVALLGFLVAWGVVTAPLWLAPVVAAGAAVAFLLFASWRFDVGEAWSSVYPVGAVLLAAVAGVVIRYLTETRERRLVAELFAPYVPAAVGELLLDQGLARRAADGERTEVAVLFCDIRGFTPLAGERPAAEVRDLLTTYYELTTQVILDHGGTLMQYVGDEVFAVFGAPLAQEDHADRAMACAQALQAARHELVDRLVAHRLPPLAYGVGIHAGEVVAAHVGGKARRQYSVIGATVNIGSRVCGLAGPGEIACTRAVLERLDTPVATRGLGPVHLKGVEVDPEVHLVVDT